MAARDRYKVALVKDLAGRKHAEEASLRVINTIPIMAWTLLPDGSLDFVNERWLDYTGLSLQEAVATPTAIVHPKDLPAAVAQWSASMIAGRAHEAELRLRRADGEYRWFLVRVVPLRNDDGDIVKWYGTSTDIEDRKRAEDGSRHAAEELQALSRRLVELQEAERRTLSRELHDRVGQDLTALSIQLGIVRDALPAHVETGIRARLEDAAALVRSTASTIANVIADLRPPMLDDYGLPAALRWYARQFSERAGVAVSVEAGDSPGRIARDVEIALFRIAQEALTNVAKHARARQAVITLERAQSDYVMSIADDGLGMAAIPQRPEGQRPGLGLVTMRERAQAVGGRFSVEPVAGGGIRLTVRVPA